MELWKRNQEWGLLSGSHVHLDIFNFHNRTHMRCSCKQSSAASKLILETCEVDANNSKVGNNHRTVLVAKESCSVDPAETPQTKQVSDKLGVLLQTLNTYLHAHHLLVLQFCGSPALVVALRSPLLI